MLNAAIDAVGGAPVILKDPFGSYGSGVVIAESKRAARSVLDAMATPILMVQSIFLSLAVRIRVFCSWQQSGAAMERSAQAEELFQWTGRETRPVEVSDRYAQLPLPLPRR